MHVAYIHQHFSTRSGATGTRSYELSQRLIKAGHRVTLISGVNELSPLKEDPNARVTETDVDGIRVLSVSEPYKNSMGFVRRVRAFGRFARTATQLVKTLDADLVFATSTPLTVGIPGMKGAKHLNVPFVFEVRDLWPELPIAMGIVRNPALKWYLRHLEVKIYRAAKWIIALSPGIREGICGTGYPESQTTIIPNASDLDVFKPVPHGIVDSQYGHPGDFKLVFTGAHGLANGLDAVLDAIGELKNRGESGIRFNFIGHGGQKQGLMERCERENLGAWTNWIEPMPKQQLADILPRMDVGMMILKNIPAFYYGTSPNKFFDYIASGLPVLNNYPGWLAGMIEESKCGMVVPPNDPKAFADAVLWMRDHPEELRAMGPRSRNLAETRFSRQTLGENFVAILEQVYERNKGN
jgi:glycosyltransferase involved in cell wall biosynthesis